MKITRKSMFTGKTRTVDIPCTQAQLDQWAAGVNIQTAMPSLTPAEREFILTGTWGTEWDDALGPEPDESDPDEQYLAEEGARESKAGEKNQHAGSPEMEFYEDE